MVPSVSALLRKYRLTPKKGLSQNFLVDPNILDKLVDALNLSGDDEILEIGSGLGVLTGKIANHARHVWAIEKDRQLFEIAIEEFGKRPNIDFVCGDFLELDLGRLGIAPVAALKGIGNIPYHLTHPILSHLLQIRKFFREVLLTVQKEVAQHLVAKPGQKGYGSISVLFQAVAKPSVLFDISPHCFWPPPKVTSSTFLIDFEPAPTVKIQDFEWFRTLVYTCFHDRRRMLKNALAKFASGPRLEKVFKDLRVSPQGRPEILEVSDFIRLAELIKKQDSATR